jgi:LacI family transcriptional regulator, galactose operon repressor
MDGRVTIAELARRSGVSKGTVSRALNGYDDVNPATRERITQLARELGYEPDGPARALRTRRSLLVAAYLGRCGTDLSQPFFRPVLAALSTRLRAAGYGVMDVEGTADVGHIRRGGLDGAVVMSMDPDNPLIAALDAAGIPCVGVDVAIAAHVAADNRGGTALAVRHLAQLGHRRIAAIAGIQTTLAGRERLEGYRTGLAAELLPYDPALVAFGDYSAASGEDAVGRLLPAAPTAIVAASDLMAIGATRALTAAGRRVPDDVSVVGFDDLPVAVLVRPELTTVRQDPMRIGAAAADALLARMEGNAAGRRTTIPVELMVRASTAAQSAP